MQSSSNYYQILGVSPDATLEEIRQAYRRLARQYHPDLHAGDKASEEKFKEISLAYETLHDPQRRREYDRHLETETTSDRTVQESYERGLKHARRGDSQRAATAFTRAIETRPDFAPAYSERGLARAKLLDYTGAFEDYNQALRLDPDSGQTYGYRGQTRYKLGYLQGAVEDFNQAIARHANFAKAYYYRGLAYRELDDAKAAISDLQVAIDLFDRQGDRLRARRTEQILSETRQNSVVARVSWGANWLRFPTATVTAFRQFALNPVGGLLPAYARLNATQAIAVSGILALGFDLCFAIGLYFSLREYYQFEIARFIELAILGLIPWISLSGFSGLARLILRGSGSWTGDLFVASASLWLSGIALIVAGLTTNLAIVLIPIAFAICYLILTLYSGYTQILHLSERQAIFAIPIALLFVGWMFRWSWAVLW
jgi:curved DNA-binding protein CbpA